MAKAVDRAEFLDKLHIDRYALDDMLVEQPQLQYEVANAYALAASERDEAKERLQRVDSEIAALLRATADQEGRKITETAISQLILTHDRHLAALAEYLSLKQRAEQLGAARDAFAQRAYMLRDLVQLYVAGYFSRDSVKGKTAAAEQVATELRRQRINAERQRLQQ